MSAANETEQETRDMLAHEGHALKYTIVWAVLVVATGLTVFTGRMHLADWGLIIALVIATVKGALVALYFMHLADHHGANRLVFVTSVIFVVLLIGLTMGDVGTRFPLAISQGSPMSELPASDFLRKQVEEVGRGQHEVHLDQTGAGGRSH